MDLYIKILEIQIGLELKDYDWLFFKIKSLDKYLSRLKKKEADCASNTLESFLPVISILKKLVNSGFDYQKTNAKFKQEVVNFSKESDQNLLYRDISSVMPFKDWFQEKVMDQKVKN